MALEAPLQAGGDTHLAWVSFFRDDLQAAAHNLILPLRRGITMESYAPFPGA